MIYEIEVIELVTYTRSHHSEDRSCKQLCITINLVTMRITVDRSSQWNWIVNFCYANTIAYYCTCNLIRNSNWKLMSSAARKIYTP